MRPDAYIRLFLWDDTSDTSPSPGCDTDDDNNACNDNINDPDGLDADVDVTAVHFDGFNAKTDGNLSGVIDAIANALEGTIANIIKNALSNGIKSALASAFPIDMNNLLGNPWNTGTGLLDVGIYPSTSLPSDGNGNKVVPVYCSDGSTSQKTVNATYVNGGKWDAPLTYCGFVLPAAVAVEPILFNSNCSRDTDLSNPEPTDFFGICTLHNYDGSEDDDQQFDMNDGNGSDYYGPPLIYKANAPPQDVIPPHLDTIQQIQYYGSGKNSWGNYDTVLYDANHNDIKDDGSCSDSGFTDSNHDGLDDNNSNCALYDMALAIHYNFLSQALYSMYASGLLDYAISATEPIGSSRRKVTFLSQSMLKQLLNVNTFSSIIPVLKSIAKDNSYVAIRAVPRSTPYAKTGVDHYDNTTYGVPGTKGTGTYDVRLYFPGVDFEFWFQDKNGVYKRIFTLRWNLMVGADIEFYKGCHPLDPAAGTSRCTDPDDPAYIPGYLMIYAEINNPDVMGTLGYDPVQVIESEIDIDTGILHNQISNLLGILLSAFVELKIEMRMPRLILGDTLAQGLTFDIWYFGPDGPSATNTTKGDYLGVYLSLLGNVNIFNLMGNLSLTGGAPSWKNMYPDTTIVAPSFPDNNKIVTLSAEDFKSLGFSRNNVAFSWDGNSDYENHSDLIYTYRIDGGLWHPPVHKRITNFHFLPDGRHVFEVAAIHHIGPYQFIDPTPARVEFTIDTTPPEIHFIGGTEYTSDDSIVVNVSDFPERPDDDVQISWSIDGKKFTDWTESRLIPLAGLEKGTHRLVVKAKDSARNIAQKGLIFEVKEKSGFGCSSGNSMDGLLMLIGLISGFLLFKNIVRRA